MIDADRFALRIQFSFDLSVRRRNMPPHRFGEAVEIVRLNLGGYFWHVRHKHSKIGACMLMCAQSHHPNGRKAQPMKRRHTGTLQLPPPPMELDEQLRKQRRTVDFDTFDIHTKQLIEMLKEDQIQVSPRYQRKFRWQADRCSQFIESLLLGIPVPSLFMATNQDN